VNVIVHLEHPEQNPPLGHGFRVDVRVVVFEADNVVRVPTDALVRNGAGWAAFRIEHGRARFTPVNIGDGGEDFHLVRSGLAPGQRVILFPSDTLRDGDVVRAANAHH
jgi:HlyD family secretion protein